MLLIVLIMGLTCYRKIKAVFFKSLRKLIIKCTGLELENLLRGMDFAEIKVIKLILCKKY